MASLFNQTNKNQNRYFFATTEAGEQDLYLSNVPSGPVTDTFVGISGPAGNMVQINQMPDIIGTTSAGGEEMLYAGTASVYKTLSSLSQTASGISLGTDRLSGSGVATIESYGTNGSLKGFEFLSRGTTSELLSTNSVGINNYMSSIGRPGASAVLGATGTFLTSGIQASQIQSLDVATGGGGRTCFNINDLSGAGGLQSEQRWSIGTSTIPTGNNQGSDFTIFSYTDAGAFSDSPLKIKRSQGEFAITNLSSIQTYISTSAYPAQIYPTQQTNVEFGAEGQNEVIAGSASNQSLYGQTWAPLFSTFLTGCNPNGKTFLSINWENALSTGSNHVNYKVGFSTATAYTNVIQTSYVPGGQFTPSDLPSANTPIGHTNITCCLDPDGVSQTGGAFLYVQGQLSDPNAPADQIYIAKGASSEPTRYALTWHPM